MPTRSWRRATAAQPAGGCVQLGYPLQEPGTAQPAARHASNRHDQGNASYPAIVAVRAALGGWLARPPGGMEPPRPTEHALRPSGHCLGSLVADVAVASYLSETSWDRRRGGGQLEVAGVAGSHLVIGSDGFVACA